MFPGSGGGIGSALARESMTAVQAMRSPRRWCNRVRIGKSSVSSRMVGIVSGTFVTLRSAISRQVADLIQA